MTGAYLLCYLTNLESLSKVLRNIRAVLLPGGRFAGLTMNINQGLSDQPANKLHEWGAVAYGRKNVENGGVMSVDISLGRQHVPERVQLDVVFWDQPTYEKAFRDAGFSSVVWVPVTPNPNTTAEELANHIVNCDAFFDAHKSVGFVAIL